MPVAKRPVSYAAQLASALVLAAALAGCSGEPQAAAPGAGAGSGASSAPRTEAATTAPPTPVGPAPSGLPEGASERSEAGATAFVTHYFARLNQAWQGPRTKVLPSFALSSCKTCEKYQLTAEELAAAKRHYDGKVLAVQHVAGLASTAPTDEQYTVEAHFKQLPVSLVDASGRTVSTEEPFAGTLLFQLAYEDGWHISEIETKA